MDKSTRIPLATPVDGMKSNDRPGHGAQAEEDTTRRYGLIGQRLGHSYSEQYFREKFATLGLKNHSYRLYEMPTLDGLHECVRREGLNGFNVTIPYKKSIIPHLDAIDPEAEAIGAVNCVTIHGDNLMEGHNTDAPAFLQTLADRHWQAGQEEVAIILGTGGAASAVSHALSQSGVDHWMVSRRQQGNGSPRRPSPRHDGSRLLGTMAYTDLPAIVRPVGLLVNATPVGMFPNESRTPVDLAALAWRPQLVYDLVYNPSPTLLMRQATALGIATTDGLAMLHLQADLAWSLFQRP